MAWRKFNDWFKDYLKYNKNGLVPKSFVTPEGYHLGSWVSTIRRNKSKLTQEQIELLNQHHFVWKVKNARRSFEEWLADFDKYNIDGRVPYKFITPEGYNLSCWVSNIRKRKDSLTTEQIELLNQHNFVWEINKIYKRFEEAFKDYLKYNKNGLVLTSFITPEGYHLGYWVKNIRNGRIELTKKQIELLNQHHFVWKVREYHPSRSFDEWLVDFIKYNKNGIVELNFVTPEGYSLGAWVSNIRQTKAKLTQEQIERLNQHHFVWKVTNSPRTFDEYFVDFVKYNENGYLARDFRTPEGYNLGIWLFNVRYGQIKTTKEQREKLMQYGVKFGPKVIAEML